MICRWRLMGGVHNGVLLLIAPLLCAACTTVVSCSPCPGPEGTEYGQLLSSAAWSADEGAPSRIPLRIGKIRGLGREYAPATRDYIYEIDFVIGPWSAGDRQAQAVELNAKHFWRALFSQSESLQIIRFDHCPLVSEPPTQLAYDENKLVSWRFTPQSVSVSDGRRALVFSVRFSCDRDLAGEQVRVSFMDMRSLELGPDIQLPGMFKFPSEPEIHYVIDCK